MCVPRIKSTFKNIGWVNLTKIFTSVCILFSFFLFYFILSYSSIDHDEEIHLQSYKFYDYIDEIRFYCRKFACMFFSYKCHIIQGSLCQLFMINFFVHDNNCL